MIPLTPPTQKFILHWGEMGERWGVNRTVAQIYALLYMSPDALTAEEISEALSIARSTVSTGLRELQNWGVVKSVQMLGERCERFTTLADIWEMFRMIVDERKRRELDPTLRVLHETLNDLDPGDESLAYPRQRLSAMLELFDLGSTLYAQVQTLPTSTLIRLAKMSDLIRKILGLLPGS